MTQKNLIAETEHVVAIEQDLGGEDVVVIFNPAWQGCDGVRFTRDDFLLRHGITAIGIVSVVPNWYPPHAMAKVLAAVRDRVGNRRVTTCGQGQGGYGALKFAAAVRASRVVAFSPQWSIDPADVGSFDTRFARHFAKDLRNGLRIEQGEICAPALIFFDHMEGKDARHAAKLAQLKGVHLVATPFSEDQTLRILVEGHSISALVRTSAVPTSSSATDLRRVIRHSRKRSPFYLDYMMRRLIGRTGRSRRGSVALVMTLLGETRETRFYSAILAHTEGNAGLARRHLQSATDKAFADVELLSWRRALRDIGFRDGEMAVASKILEHQPTNVHACLQVVDTLIFARDTAAAERELKRLVKLKDVQNHVGLVLKHAVTLRTPEVLETLLVGVLPPMVRSDVLFSLVDLYQVLGKRPSAAQKLNELATICGDSSANLRRLATGYLKLDEASRALEILQGLFRESPEDCHLGLDIVEARIRTDKKRALSELNAMMGKPNAPRDAWQRASQLYVLLGQIDVALQAISRSIELGDSGPLARHRLALLLRRKGRRRQARQELEIILADARATNFRLRVSGDLAIELGDRELAYRFAQAQFQRTPTNPESILYLARGMRQRGEQDAARRLASSLFDEEQKRGHLSGQQLIRLAEELYKVGDFVLAKQAIARTLKMEPGSAAATALIATIELTERLARPKPP